MFDSELQHRYNAAEKRIAELEKECGALSQMVKVAAENGAKARAEADRLRAAIETAPCPRGAAMLAQHNKCIWCDEDGCGPCWKREVRDGYIPRV